MTLDQTKVGQVVTAQMEALEEAYGEDCEIGDVCTIVEVIGPHGSDVRVRSSELRPHVAMACYAWRRASSSRACAPDRRGRAADALASEPVRLCPQWLLKSSFTSYRRRTLA